jgi:Fe-S-cluster containining protein
MECIQCGNCCTNKQTDRIPIDKSDILNWRNKKAFHLYTIDMLHEWNMFGVTNKFGNEMGVCPFISKIGDKFICRIQDLKPKVCREFKPGALHSVKYCKCQAI